ncbi:MAG TPA: DUF1800 domain-containing protein [Verrucomicrobiae bacterium]|nr:DUF1800 domain-containing protein [Verrucomicrobiae bacterium]
MLKALAKKNWNFTTAAHLLNRAGFGGTPKEIAALESMGLEQAVAHLVDYEKIPDSTPDPDWAKPDPTRAERLRKARDADPEARRKMVQEEQRNQRQNLIQLKHWWLERMASGPRPLQEKMTLFWHGHFATSAEKVRDAYLMWMQNDLFRKQATGFWLELLIATGKDPAMLVWLDQAKSRKEHPNENFAREVMELFTLGEGHYTEKDITEGARALTGWTYDGLDQEFIERPRFHDTGQKTFLGQTGNLNGDDVLRIIVAQPQAARFITGKIWNFFAGEEPSEELTTALADVFRKAGSNFKPLLKAIFNSEEFYADNIIGNQVKSPVQWLVGSVRVLERDLPGPFICFGLTKNLGQDLFQPPNVKGWDGGLSWITTNNLLARYNEAAILVQGDFNLLRTTMFAAGVNPQVRNTNNMLVSNRLRNLRLETVDVEKILTVEERNDKGKLLAALEKRLLQGKLRGKQEQALREYLDGQSSLDDGVILKAIRLMMSTPEYQLT